MLLKLAAVYAQCKGLQNDNILVFIFLLYVLVGTLYRKRLLMYNLDTREYCLFKKVQINACFQNNEFSPQVANWLCFFYVFSIIMYS